MTITPDLDSLLDRHGLFLIGLEVLDRADGTVPTVFEVSQFLKSRSILAGISAGSVYGSKVGVVANLAAFKDSGAIVVSQDNGQLGQGQEAESLFGGMAYALGTNIILDEDTLVDPKGEFHEYDHADSNLVLTQSLSTFQSEDAAPGFTILLSTPGTGHLGRLDQNNLVLPQTGYMLLPSALNTFRTALPLITFEKSGQLRSVLFSPFAAPTYALTLNCGPIYSPVIAGEGGTAIQKVATGLTQVPEIIVDDELIASSTPRKGKPIPGHQQLADLIAQGPELVQGNRQEFFLRVAEVLSLDPEVIAALAAFEEAPGIELLPGGAEQNQGAPKLAGIALTPVQNDGLSPLQIASITLVLQDLLNPKRKKRRNSKGSRVLTLALSLLLLVLFAAIGISGQVTAQLGLRPYFRIIAGVFALATLVGIFGQVLWLKGCARAQGIIDQARANGVLKR